MFHYRYNPSILKMTLLHIHRLLWGFLVTHTSRTPRVASRGCLTHVALIRVRRVRGVVGLHPPVDPKNDGRNLEKSMGCPRKPGRKP